MSTAMRHALLFLLACLPLPALAQEEPAPFRVSSEALDFNRTPSMAARDWIWRGSEDLPPLLAGRMLEVEVACTRFYGFLRCRALTIADLPAESEVRAIAAFNRYLELWVVGLDPALAASIVPDGPGVVASVTMVADALMPVPAELRPPEVPVDITNVQMGTLTARVEYPRRAIRTGMEGLVLLDCYVHTDLSVACTVLSADPPEFLREFTPPIEVTLLRGRVEEWLADGGSAAGARFTLPLRFVLN